MPTVASIIIPTHNRPQLLRRAVASALNQTVPNVEVIVVDDGSEPPVALKSSDPRLHLVRNHHPMGVCAARNTGLELAHGDYVTFLDDDDELTPTMVETMLAAVASSKLQPPVAAIGSIKVLDTDGRVRREHRPFTAERGLPHFLGLAAHDKASFVNTNYATLFIPTETARSIGGFDPNLRAWEHDELLLRLNPVCSILAVDAVTHKIHEHPGPRNSRDYLNMARGIEYTWRKHREAFAKNRVKEAKYLATAATYYLQAGRQKSALRLSSRAVTIHPSPYIASRFAAALVGRTVAQKLARVFRTDRDKRGTSEETA